MEIRSPRYCPDFLNPLHVVDLKVIEVTVVNDSYMPATINILVFRRNSSNLNSSASWQYTLCCFPDIAQLPCFRISSSTQPLFIILKKPPKPSSLQVKHISSLEGIFEKASQVYLNLFIDIASAWSACFHVDLVVNLECSWCWSLCWAFRFRSRHRGLIFLCSYYGSSHKASCSLTRSSCRAIGQFTIFRFRGTHARNHFSKRSTGPGRTSSWLDRRR